MLHKNNKSFNGARKGANRSKGNGEGKRVVEISVTPAKANQEAGISSSPSSPTTQTKATDPVKATDPKPIVSNDQTVVTQKESLSDIVTRYPELDGILTPPKPKDPVGPQSSQLPADPAIVSAFISTSAQQAAENTSADVLLTIADITDRHKFFNRLLAKLIDDQKVITRKLDDMSRYHPDRERLERSARHLQDRINDLNRYNADNNFTAILAIADEVLKIEGIKRVEYEPSEGIKEVACTETRKRRRQLK